MPALKHLLVPMILASFTTAVGSGLVHAQSEESSADPLDLIPDVQQAARVNENTVGIVFSNDELVNHAMEELALEVKEHADIRLVPILGNHDVQNVYDLLFLKGVDSAVVRTDAVEYVKRRGNFPTVTNVVNAMLAVHTDKILILANKEITSVGSLDGKKVAVGQYASGEYITTSVMSDVLGISPEYVFTDTIDGLEKLKDGEVSALVYHFHAGHEEEHEDEHEEEGHDSMQAIFSAVRDFDGNESIHVLPLPTINEGLQAIYSPSRLTPEDLPNLIKEGSDVETFSVDTVLAVYRWRPNNPRYEKSSRFVDAFIESIDHLKESTQHEFWGELDITAEVHGMTRLAMVDELLILRERQEELEEQERAAQLEAIKESARVAKLAKLAEQREEILQLLDQKITETADLEQLEVLLEEINSIATKLD